jgi:hypothetical protein
MLVEYLLGIFTVDKIVHVIIYVTVNVNNLVNARKMDMTFAANLT